MQQRPVMYAASVQEADQVSLLEREMAQKLVILGEIVRTAGISISISAARTSQQKPLSSGRHSFLPHQPLLVIQRFG